MNSGPRTCAASWAAASLKENFPRASSGKPYIPTIASWFATSSNAPCSKNNPTSIALASLFPTAASIWLYTRAKVILNSENQVVRRFGVTQDITEKVQTEQRLSTTEERYRDLVENSTDLICTHDLHGRLLSMNDRPARLLGYRSEDLIGRQIPDMLLPQYRDQFAAYIATLRREGHVEGLVSVHTHAGERRVWEYRNTLRTAGVAARIVRGFARDVTDKIRAERSIQESEALANQHLAELNAIYDTAPVGLALSIVTCATSASTTCSPPPTAFPPPSTSAAPSARSFPTSPRESNRCTPACSPRVIPFKTSN
jgi:PAS domain S-box-containing protein